MPPVPHPQGNYLFLPGIAPYSAGVVAQPGFEVVHVTLESPVPWRRGFELVEQHLAKVNRPRFALCAMELRSPRPFSFSGFAEFNREYASVLESWGLFVNGVNPVARTNVAPEVTRVTEECLFAFSYTRPCVAGLPATFIVAGGGELPEGVLAAEAIVARGDVSAIGLATKARFVLGLMEERLRGLGQDWPAVTAIDVYTVHSLDQVVREVVLPQAGIAALAGVTWYYTRPPIEEIEFEMDLRGVRTELRLPVG